MICPEAIQERGLYNLSPEYVEKCLEIDQSIETKRSKWGKTPVCFYTVLVGIILAIAGEKTLIRYNLCGRAIYNLGTIMVTQYFRERDTLAAEEEIMTDVLDENLLKAERTKIENWYARHHDPGLQIVFFDVKKNSPRLERRHRQALGVQTGSVGQNLMTSESMICNPVTNFINWKPKNMLTSHTLKHATKIHKKLHQVHGHLEPK